MDLEIRGKTALVLGAGGGLGGAIATSLGAEGVRVAVADLDEASLQLTAAAITSAGGESLQLAWDLRDLASIAPNLDKVNARFGPVDILVNNTGGPPPSTAEGQSPERWREHFEAMVLSVIALTDQVLPSMRASKWGRIITSTSSGVIAPIPNLGLSNSLRMALVGWSKTLAREVGPDGITSNIILPGRIATKRITFIDEKRGEREGRSVDAVRSESAGSIPLGRYGEPGEYGDVVAFLASKRASYITGSIIRVDGGLIASV